MSDRHDIPFVDPRIEFVGTSRLRDLNARNLRDLRSMLVIVDGETRLAVLLRYDSYMELQAALQRSLAAICSHGFTTPPPAPKAESV